MNNRVMKLLLRGSVGLIASVVTFGAVAQQKLEPLSVRLDWTPWGVHAAFHLAKDKGWYEQAGLDVRIEDGNGSVTTVQIVGSGNSFDIGHASLGSMIIARDKGLPVKALATFARKSDIGVLAPVDSGIKGPQDLKGKKVLYTAGSLEAPFIDAFLDKEKIKRDEVELVNIDAAAKITSYAVGRSDAVVSTIAYVLPFVSDQRESRAIAFADYGLNMPGFGILTNENKLATKKDALAKFASVTARTWQYIYEGHQDEAVDAILAQRPQARLNKKILRGQIDELHNFMGERSKDGRIGVPVLADWEEGIATLRSVGLIGDKLKADELIATDVVHPENYDAIVSK